MIWPTCSLVTMTGEDVGLVPGILRWIRYSPNQLLLFKAKMKTPGQY